MRNKRKWRYNSTRTKTIHYILRKQKKNQKFQTLFMSNPVLANSITYTGLIIYIKNIF